MQKTQEFTEAVKNYRNGFYPIVPLNPATDKLLPMDFTESNKELNDHILKDTDLFSQYINNKLQSTGTRYGVGGYNEHRTIYSRSELFGTAHPEAHSGLPGGKNGPHPNLPPVGEGTATAQGQPVNETESSNDTSQSEVSAAAKSPLRGVGGLRRLHLGLDIWGEGGTPIYAPLEATVHSFAFNDAFGDYGATLILQHELDGVIFYTLYGHLSLHSIADKKEGQSIEKGEWIAAFGEAPENGHWPPHLHFQIILDMEGKKGDYPGVCSFYEREIYLLNCPDPDLLTDFKKFIEKE